MKPKVDKLVDFNLFQTVFEGFKIKRALSTSIAYPDGNTFNVTTLSDFCLHFHLKNPKAAEKCHQNCRFYPELPNESHGNRIFCCPHGLTVGIKPIVLDGKQLGSLIYGRVFIEKSNLEELRTQALNYGYPENDFMKAVEEVPVTTKEQINDYLDKASWLLHVLLNSGAEKQENKDKQLTSGESEERFKFFFDLAPDAIILAEAETGIIVNANLAASIMIGKPIEEIIGTHHSQIYPERDRADMLKNFKSSINSLLSTGEMSPLENIVVRSDGAEIPVEIQSSVFTIGDKHLIQGIFRDLSAFKKSQINQHLQHEISLILGQARDLNQALNQVLEKVCQIENVDCGGIYLVDSISGEINLHANYGLSEQFVEQCSHYLASSPNASILQAGVPVYYSFPEIQEQNKMKLLQEKIHSLAVIPLLYDNKAVAALSLASHRHDEILEETRLMLESIGSSLGSTIQRINAERRLTESEEKYRLAFRTSPDAINITAMDGKYVDVNLGFIDMTGYCREEVIGFSSLELDIWTIPEDRKKLVEGLKKHGKVENLESVFKAKDGRLITALMSANLISINNKPHILSITRDITDREKIEIELLSSKEKAEESNRLKSSFLANISHELRTPMNGILGFAELLDDESLSHEEKREYISVISDSGRSLLEVITNIVDISKIESGQLEKRIRLFDLNRLLDEIIKSFLRENIIQQKSHLKVEVMKELPDERSLIYSDPSKISHVFSLLLNNAAKFTDKGSIQFGYYLIDDSYIRFFVRDTGKGIPAIKQKSIFERFRQEEESLSRRYGGVGLGLTIAKGLVEMLGGKIWVESEPGTGSEFSFEIPFESDSLN